MNETLTVEEKIFTCPSRQKPVRMLSHACSNCLQTHKRTSSMLKQACGIENQRFECAYKRAA